MKSSRLRRCCSFPHGAALLIGLASLLGGGCRNLFVARHKVLVDAIAAKGTTKPAGLSYRLVAKRSIISATPVQIPVVKACVDAALATQGMFEPPASAAPDLFIEVSYGRDTAPRADPTARETFLELSARTNPDHSTERATGPEIWDVKVSILGLAGQIESAMPLLSAVASNYVATDTRIETKVEVPQNSPMVQAVRTTAIKSLEDRNAPPATDAPGAAAPPPAPTAAPAVAPTK